VSLILEALRKLDREKETPERGFVVVASEPWPARARHSGRGVTLALVAVAAVVATILFVNRTRSGPTLPPTPNPTLPTVSAAVPTSVTTTTLLAAPNPSPRPVTVPHAPPAVTAAVGAPPASQRPAPASPPSLVLQAISERDGKPIALLSDRLVREGDEFEGVRVIRIGEAEVEVEWHGQRSVVRF
jgi:hypothetical protein